MQPLSENAVNVPAFLNKLWRMVNDPSTDHLISWGPGGKSFIIQNQAQFWYELLPVYYKHNNMSSFVRQLNMYGFHKMSTVENGTMDNEKDEIQFYHPCFQIEQPELLKLIKRKVTGTKVTNTTTPVQSAVKSDDLTKVLSDVKYLRGKQANVDSQLSAMKQENAVLWRELAMLRQKHMKQQQIVNKLIQFLVTIVQPNTRMGGLGVKRHYPLMLSDCPKAKKNNKACEGPTIHELDNCEIVADEILAEAKDNLLEADIVDQDANPLVDELLSDSEMPADTLDDVQTNSREDNLVNLDESDDLYSSNEKIFLNSTAPDTLLTNLINGSYNSDLLNKDNKDNKQSKKDNELGDLAVARVEYGRMNSLDEFDDHVDKTQSEIDQLKDILHGCNSLDANALLGLFNDDSPDYGLTYQQNAGDNLNKSDPLVSGSELTTYNTGLIDFSQLFDDTSDPQDIPQECGQLEDPSASINTPQISNEVPVFPNTRKEMGDKKN